MAMFQSVSWALYENKEWWLLYFASWCPTTAPGIDETVTVIQMNMEKYIILIYWKY